MSVREMAVRKFRKGDLVRVASLDEKLTFCIIGLRTNEKGCQLALLKGLFNQDLIIEKPVEELTNLLIRGLL